MIVEKAKTFLEALRSKFFPTEEDDVWKQWVEYKRRDTNDLIRMLTSSVRDSLKRRAVFLLIVPAKELSPINWTEEVGNFYHSKDFLKKLSPELLDYAVKLIIDFHMMIKPLHSGRPEYYCSGHRGGVIIHGSTPERYHDALYFYNECIMLLLEMLPEDQCERIFPLFSLQDVSSYSDFETSSGYNPFLQLLHSNVDEKWKKRADSTMREIIKSELSGKTKPREDWEGALRCYADIINLQSYGLSYSVELYADQIKFLVSKEHYGNNLIDEYRMAEILKILSADVFRETRYDIARFVFFGRDEEPKFWIGSSLEGAEMVLNEFGQEDKELAQKAQAVIDEYKARDAENQKEKAKAQKAEDDIMSKMM